MTQIQERVSLHIIAVLPSARRDVLKTDENGLEILDEQIISKQGALTTVKRWYKGIHPELGGVIIKGFTGWETVVEGTVIRPVHRFVVHHIESETAAQPATLETVVPW